MSAVPRGVGWVTTSGGTFTPVDEGELRALVARFWALEPTNVDDRLRFDPTHLRNMTSLRFFRFLAAVESKFGIRLADPSTITSYAALRAAIGGGGSVGQGPSVELNTGEAASGSGFGQAGAPAALCLGHDVEEIENLPEAEDFFTDPFYIRQFTAQEILKCAGFPNARQHFAVRFCAKEALRKCGRPFDTLQPTSIEIDNDQDGRPFVVIHDPAVQEILASRVILVSLSHTEKIASAVVLIALTPLGKAS